MTADMSVSSFCGDFINCPCSRYSPGSSQPWRMVAKGNPNWPQVINEAGHNVSLSHCVTEEPHKKVLWNLALCLNYKTDRRLTEGHTSHILAVWTTLLHANNIYSNKTAQTIKENSNK